MVDILYYFIIGFIVGGTGTFIGGLLSVMIPKPNDKTTASMLMLAAGIMLSVISFDLMPQAYEIGGFFIVTLGLVFGLFIVFFAEKLIPMNKFNKYKGKKSNYIKMSLIIIISMSLHNFPEGIAVGSSAVYSENLGIKIGILIAAHDIPEGMSVGIPLIMAGASPLSVLLITLLTGIPTAFGAVLGALLGNISKYFIGFCLSAAASSMLYVTSNELIPEANLLHRGKSNAVFILIGFICGCYLSFAM